MGSFSDYQTEIYARGVLQGVVPLLTTDPNKLRLHAKKAMSEEAYNYVAGGAGEGATMDANRLAFRQWKIVPRMMRPSMPRSLKVTLFGDEYGTLETREERESEKDRSARTREVGGWRGSRQGKLAD
jgi:hypothetical protein